MFGRSPPNILATLILSFLVLVQFCSSLTQAKPHQRRDFLGTNTAGTNEGVFEGDWQKIVNLKNGEDGEIQRRSPTEVEDQIFEVSQAKTLSVGTRKREGIETPIKPLTSDSSLDLPRSNTEENVRSKVDQPSSESVGVKEEQENKVVGDGSSTQRSNGDNDTTSTSTQNESNEGHENDISSVSAENVDFAKDRQRAMESNNASSVQDKADSSKVSANSDSTSENNKGQVEHESELTSTVDENAQVRSFQESATTRNDIGNVRSDKSDTIEENQPRSGPSSTTAKQHESQTTNTKTVDKQPESGVSKGTIAKSETSGLISSSEKKEAPTETGQSLKTSSATREDKPINTLPHTETTSAEPIRDTLGNSGSEIVTTHRRREPELDSEKDTWAKPSNDPASESTSETSSETSNGPEVGHFQVDDKSADLEINANSAGVKVKAKPASLQVVSRPGSHSASGAQERSFFGHYHYPPFDVHHHWFPLMRRSYGHFHRRHFFNPYSPFAERRSFDGFYGEAPFYRRRLPYWYPRRHRHHFHDSYLYERSRLEEPDEFSRHRRRRHKRRFRHLSRPYRRQFYNNNIPIMNGMDAPPIGVAPEEGTMPQLPIGPVAPYTQRQNIVTPVPPPINVAGNPPPGILGGMNAAMFGMNGMDNLNEINPMNSAFNGLNPVGSFGFSTPQQMGSMGGLPSETTRGFGAIEGPQMALKTVRTFRPTNLPFGSSRRAFKKTSILSGKTNNDTKMKNQFHDENPKVSRAFSDKKLERTHAYHNLRKKEVNLKSWQKTLKRYHSLTKGRKGHKFRRSNAASTGTESEKFGKKNTTKIHPQHAKEAKAKRKNEIVMHRPPIIYHPPPEIYHRPDIVVHRAPIMLHRPPIIYHQPPVVVHRPAIIYHQPPIVFHQPPPMVHQPILHSRDTWVTKPVVYHTASTVSHDRTYYGIPSHVFAGSYGDGCHGVHCSYRKGKVPHRNNTHVRNATLARKTKRDSFSDYVSYISSLWRSDGVVKRNVHDEYDVITSSDGAKQKLSYRDFSVYNMHKRDKTTENGSPPVKRDSDDLKTAPEKKKKDVVVNRPPIIYHPPPEIYHRPDIVVHRPPLVIHRPPIIYHQPPVIVHRPAVVYHQPPIVFHQPPPAVSQPLLYSHDSFTVHPTFYATHHGSVVRDFGHYIGVPNVITNYGNPLFGRGPPMGKRSTTEVPPSNKNGTLLDERKHKKAKNESNEKAGKKNTVLVHRPPIIYHPPPEIYHRPIIVVHRPPIMIHRAPIFYHQPPVVVHRPAIVYHQPPLIFHQPPPMVHQPVLKSHDTWISHPVVFPYSSRVMHHHTYVGVPDAYTVHHYEHYGGQHGFYKSHILKHSHHDEQHAFERNEITGERKHLKKQKKDSTRQKSSFLDSKKESTLRLKTKAAATQKGGKKNAVIVRRPPVIYHPPPEIYHRPDIVVHRAPIVIHRAPIIYHQPPVVVHRPAIVYHEPPLIFHQPPPVVHQPVYRAHDAYVRRPIVRLYSSNMHHAGHLYHIPHAYYHGHGGAIHYMAYGKSKVPQTAYLHEEKGNTRTTVNKSKKTHKRGHHTKRKHSQLTKSKDKTETGTKLHHNYKFHYHKAKDVTEKAHKKNSVVIHRPPIIYHPPPEVYHRPDIVVHRAPIVLYRAPIVYHQPPVVVHRPAIVYHQPPIVFHQPPPMVNQPVLHSHDTWVSKAVVIPYGSRVHHVATYRGVPHEDIFMHGIGTGAFGKSRVPIRGSRRNEIHGVSEKGSNAKPGKTATTIESKSRSDQGTNSLPRIIQNKKKHKGLKSADAATIMKKALNNAFPADHIKNHVEARPRIQRTLENSISGNEEPVSGVVSITRDINNVPSDFASAKMRTQRSINDLQGPMGASARIQKAIAEQWNKFEGESPYQMFKRNSEESDDSSTPDENAGKNTNSTKKTILVIHRPPILYHPPSHMIHRPSIVVHRPDIIVHRHPIVLHRPPILVHRAPIIIHRRPILIHRAPIIVHRPPLVIHRPPIVIHRRPYIIHHHPIMIHRAPIIVHKGPQMIIHHSHLIHHYPMHMIHMHCPGCGFGKSTVARLEAKRTHQENSHTSNSDRLHKESTIMDSQWKGSNLPKRSVAEMKSKRSSTEARKGKKRKDNHKKKKDVVVNRPPIIYHPPPEVYHRPDIVVHRAPILIHRPPIVYHQPPVVVHRPAVVYHQPPIVFHQPAPAVNQPLLFSHDSFVVHPMAFASHMGSVVNDAGHYVGLPHGGVSNYPGTMPHGPTGHIFPSMNSPSWSRRAEVSKPQHKKNENVNHKKRQKHRKRSTQIRDGKNWKVRQKSTKFLKQKSKQTKGERKNKVIVARPAMIYHPPPEIYDRPDIIVHRPDVVIHQPSIVYHQSSVVVHRAPVIYHQPPVVFHQPPPMVSQPVHQAHDTYVAQHVYHPHESHISHSATYVGTPHYYPGHNSFGWGLPGNSPNVHVQPPGQIPQYGYAYGPTFPSLNRYTPYLAPRAYGRSKVENVKSKVKTKDAKSKQGQKNRRRRSAAEGKHHLHYHPHLHQEHHRHHHHHHDHQRIKDFYHLYPKKSFPHIGQRKHSIVINRPPMIYYPPPKVYHQPDIVMHQPALIYHRPTLVLQQPPTIVHHPEMVYHQPSVVLHDSQPIMQTPVIPAPALVKSHMERTSTARHVSEKETATHSKEGVKSDEKRDLSSPLQMKKSKNKNASKKQSVVAIHQPAIVYHSPPEIIQKPPIVVRQSPVVVHRPPILIHRAPLVVPSPPLIIRRPPVIIHQTDVPAGYAFQKSKLESANKPKAKDQHSEKRHEEKKSSTKGARLSNTTRAERKNMVLVHRPAMIYHPPPEIYDRPDVIVHRPDVVIHRPSIVYHQPSVVVHRPPIIYRQPAVVFHQPPPMVHQPVMQAHDTYVAQPVPVPYTSHIHHGATYVGAPHFFNEPNFNEHAFGKSEVARVRNDFNSDVNKTSTLNATKSAEKKQSRVTPSAASKDWPKKKSKFSPKGHYKANKKNQVIINRPPLIYHPPPEIYDRPDIVVHRPDIVVHRPSIVYHQPSVVVHRPPIVYQSPAVVFHQPPPLENQPILYSHDTYVAHTVPVPYSSHIQHTSTYVGSPHHYPGSWNYGWSQPHPSGFVWGQPNPFGFAYGKSKIPSKETGKKDQIKGVSRKQNREKQKSGKRSGKNTKKTQVVVQRPPLIYHPPPEVYHKPDVIVHRPDVVIHRPAVVFHQPSVLVHRPPVIYHQPPVVFHQPVPMVSQPIMHSHDTYVAHPYFTSTWSNLYHAGSYVGAPHVYSDGWGEQGFRIANALSKTNVERSQKKLKSPEKKGISLSPARRTLEKETKAVDDQQNIKNITKKVANGKKKNLVVMRRPPLIYHPPPEIYHKPDVIVHRPDLVIHRPSVVLHQPSVMVHRPPVIYQQPPVIFHQPSPMVQQPILQSHDTYVSNTQFVPFTSHVLHAGSYIGAPHYYHGGWGHAFGKSKVEKTTEKQEKIERHRDKNAKDSGRKKRGLTGAKDSSKPKKQRNKKKDATKGHKKNLVIIRRPPLVYHPPPEIYHKPDVVVHRPDIVIHRPSVVFHQPSVVVHRPSVIYRQPPVVFHQPPPTVHQPIFHSQDTYVAQPHFVPYMSHLTHSGSYVGIPHFFPGNRRSGHLIGHAYGKSKMENNIKKSRVKTKTASKKSETKSEDFRRNQKGQDGKVMQKTRKNVAQLHPQKENKKDHHRKIHRKNLVLVQRPPLIYHPPPEIYARPSIIVHRPDVVIHQASVVYHQPSVVVHRPPVIYHPPPVVFHQPPPMVNQPMYTSHDIYKGHLQFVPYVSHIKHAQSYVGAPHYFPGGWNYGYGFSNSYIPRSVGFNQWSPMQQLYPHQATYLIPNTIATSSGTRKSSAFVKSDVQKYKDSKNDNPTTTKYDKRKSIHYNKKDRRRSIRSTHLAKILHKKVNETHKGGKKNAVVIRQPPLVYHPPPEVYQKPDVIVHRPDVVIHQPSVVYHQPSVMVHRPPVIYNQPPVIFHQPSPMVNQPIIHSQDYYIAHPSFVPYASHVEHASSYLGVPEIFHAATSVYGTSFGKSNVVKHASESKKQGRKIESKSEILGGKHEKSTRAGEFHPQKEKEENASRKNDIVVSRPPIIYHPPPEIYHRPDIVVHRAPIVLHRPPIIYHQPPVVVHRPAVVYHQPPVVFHQPPPTVHQPILHSHDSFIVRPNAKFFPQGSTLTHSMSYVGIPNHVLHGDETTFHMFHRSHIEDSGKKKPLRKTLTRKTPVPKSTISKIPTTNKENTQTTITDQTQKKTLRSIIHQHKLSKRQLFGSHSLFGSVSPINNIEDSHKSVEQKNKLSTIPGDTSNREKNTAKRQLVLPEPTESVLRNALPSVYDTLQMAALQNQALRATEDLQELSNANRVPFPGGNMERTEIRQYPFTLQNYLQSATRHDSPEVRVHVETTKSSIPRNERRKRQIVPLYQTQYTGQIQPIALQAPNLQNLRETAQEFSPSPTDHMFSPYHPTYSPISGPYHYLDMNTGQYRPRVNINVQSARSKVPEANHLIQKRSQGKNSKRQVLALLPPESPRFPFALREGVMPFPISLYTTQYRLPLQLLPPLDFSDESDSDETTFPEALSAIRSQSSNSYNPFNALQEEEKDNYSPSTNSIASYLRSLYRNYLGYPLYQHRRKPKVDIEVHASKSQIPKATENTRDFKSHIDKRHLNNLLPNSELIANHHYLSTAYEPKRYHLNSLHVSNSVKTAKRHAVTAEFKQSKSSAAGKRKKIPQNRTGNKRDELLQDSDNGRDISPYQENSNTVATQENQFMSSSDSYPLQNELTAGDNEGMPTQLQQQENLETDDQEQSQPQEQQQDQQDQQISEQQPISLPDQRTVGPFQHQLAFSAPMAPIQLPILPGFQPAVNLPLEAPIAPLQSVVPGALPVMSSTLATGQTGAEEGSNARKWQPKHTTIDINVGAKSIVPQTSTKSKKPRKQKFIHSLPAKGKDLQKRAQVSLLTRIPAMQVLPQTFKQNGIMMPAFDTLPVNERIKKNGMLLEELQREKKNQILAEKINKEHMKPMEKARKRQFFAVQQSYLPVQMPFLNTLQVPQIQPKLHQPRVSVHIETANKKTLKKQGMERNQKKAKQKRQIYGLSELPQDGLTQPVTLESRTQPLGYFPTSVHTPRVSINVVTSKRSKQGFQDIRKRQLLSSPPEVTGTLDEPVQSIQAPLLTNEQPEYNAVQSPTLVQAPQSTENEALQNIIQSNPSIQQQQQLTDLSSKEEGFNNRPRVTVHVEASKRDTKQKKEVHHASVVHASKLAENNEGADGYESPKISKRQLFGTVPLFSSLDQTPLSGELRDVDSARSSVPISSNTQAKRIQKRQFYSYLGGPQEQILSTQAMKDANAAEQQQQGTPIQAFEQDSSVQTELPQMSLPQGSQLPASNQYQGQMEEPESNQRTASLDSLSAFHRPSVSINVKTTKSKVPNTVETKQNWSENKGTIYPQKETKKIKRQLEILGGGGILGRRRGTKLLTSPALKKGRGRNLLGFGSNLNKPVEVFADPMTNLLAGGLAGQKRPRLGGIHIESPIAAGAVPLKGSVNQIEGPLTPGQGASAILQDDTAEEIAPFVQDSTTTESNPLLPPSAIAGPALDAFGKGNTGELPLPETTVDRAEILPGSTLNQAVVQNLPLETAPAAPPSERQVLLTPQMLPVAPILPLAPPMLIPQAPPIQSLSAGDQNVPDIRNAPPLRLVLPPIIPMPLPIAAPPSPFANPKGLSSDSEEDKPSVHVNVQTSRSNVPDVKHRSKGKTRGPPGRG